MTTECASLCGDGELGGLLAVGEASQMVRGTAGLPAFFWLYFFQLWQLLQWFLLSSGEI